MTRIIQFISKKGRPCVGRVEGDEVRILKEVKSTYELFMKCRRRQESMSQCVDSLAGNDGELYNSILEAKRIRLPLTHPDPYHTWITGTGLTHMGSAASRNTMHMKKAKKTTETDSMKMFKMGMDNGKMKGKRPAAQPEWFYKGNGLLAVDPEKELECPVYGMDGGEEPEVAGLYIVDETGEPNRIGFALGNEFSDHAMERINYLYLAHSKLRNCSYGPELLLDKLPAEIVGHSRVWRNKKILWEKEFFSGEDHMTHNIANLEHHHFKYELFRQPGDVHIHFFGTSVLSFADGVKTKSGDVFEIESATFGKALRNKFVSKKPHP